MLRKYMKIYGVGERVYIRSIIEEDKPCFDHVTYERRPYLAEFWPDYCESEWNRLAVKHYARLICAIVQKDTGTIIGFCEIKDLNTYTPSIRIQLLKKYTGNGYGGESVTLLLRHIVKVKKNIRHFVWITEEENYASNRCIKKLGGIYYGRYPQNMHDFWKWQIKLNIIDKSEVKYRVKYGLFPDAFLD